MSASLRRVDRRGLIGIDPHNHFTPLPVDIVVELGKILCALRILLYGPSVLKDLLVNLVMLSESSPKFSLRRVYY